MPHLLVSLFVVMAALSVGHYLFTGDFRHEGYFDSLMTAWHMVLVERQLAM